MSRVLGIDLTTVISGLSLFDHYSRPGCERHAVEISYVLDCDARI
jgi:hypothetical protein